LSYIYVKPELAPEITPRGHAVQASYGANCRELVGLLDVPLIDGAGVQATPH
jgi:hypothetical protein